MWVLLMGSTGCWSHPAWEHAVMFLKK
uniref:Uncharacterized protein n=1 Tax=Anguilla anguilla TaxID=7936 RepID=A0A0E9VG35_ANGAN